MDTIKGPKTAWQFETEHDKLLALGVNDHEDAENLESVANARYARAGHILGLLKPGSDDVVLDLGSGMGFVAEVIAPQCFHLHCADISSDFLNDCQERLGSRKNVEFHLIPYADLSLLEDKGVTQVYSTLLFIHFNFYDFTLYLREIYRILNPGGLLFFDFNDGDRFRYGNADDSFNGHIALYRQNRAHWIFECMHMSSLTVLRNILDQIGFEIVQIIPGRTAFTEMLVRKPG